MLLFFESDACVHGGVLVKLAGGGISGIILELTFSRYCVPMARFCFSEACCCLACASFCGRGGVFFVEGRFGISGEGFLLTSYGLQLLQCSVAFGCRCWSNGMQPAARKQWSGCRVRFRVQGIGYIELLRGKIAVRLYMPPARKHG